MAPSIDEQLRQDNPQLYDKVSELAQTEKLSFIDAFNLMLDRIKEKNPDSCFLKKYQKIKGEHPELITQQDIQELFNDPQLGRIYYDDKGQMHIEGEWMQQAISLGNLGTPILSENIVAYDANYLRQAANIAQRTFERLNFGIVKSVSFQGAENYNGVIDPTTAALLAVTLKGRSENFSDEEFKKELQERMILSFAHHIQTAQSLDEANQRIDQLRNDFTQDLEGMVSSTIDNIQNHASNWWEISRPVGEDSRFPKLHQYLRGRLSIDFGKFLFADRTGSGKTGSMFMHHLLLSQEYEKTKQRGARTLVIAPPVPSVSVWNNQEINDLYTTWLGIDPVVVTQITSPSNRDFFDEELQQQLLSIEQGGIVVLGSGKLSYMDPTNNQYLQNIIHVKGYDKDYFDTIMIDECQLVKNKSNRTLGGFDILAANPNARRLVASATPAEKDVNDLRNLMLILDPENVTDARAYDLHRDLNAVREHVFRRRAMIFSRDDLKQSHFMPEIEHEDLVIMVPPQIRNEYLEEWAQLYNINEMACLTEDESPIDNVKSIESLHKMMRILHRGKVNGVVVDEDNLSFMDFVKERAKSDKLIFFTGYHEGVQELTDLLDTAGITYTTATGKKSLDQREHDIEEGFRKDGVQALVAIGKSVESGIKIISYAEFGGHPISMFFNDPAQSAGAYNQLFGRSDRIGQIGNVKVYRTMSVFPNLEEEIMPYLQDIREGFNVDPNMTDEQIAQDFTAIDESAYSIIDRWRAVFDDLLDRNSTQDIRQLLEQGSAGNNYGLDIHNGLLRLMIFDSPHRIATNFFKTHNGVDFEGLQRAQQSGAWQRTVMCYNHNWEYSASAYALTTVRDITRAITEHTGQEFNGRIDLGAGAAYASRAFLESFICLDMDPLMLQVGEEIVEKLVQDNPEAYDLVNNSYIQSTIQDTGLHFPDESDRLDLVITSYVWQYQAQRVDSEGRVMRQLEDALIEANRILKAPTYDSDGSVLQPGGWLFATLPWSLRKRRSSFDKVCRNVGNYGFESTPLSGVYEPQRCRELIGDNLQQVRMPSGGSSRGFLLFALRKVEDYVNDGYVGNPCDYALFDEKKIQLSLGQPKQPRSGRRKQRPAQRKQLFDLYQKETGESIQDIVSDL